MSNRELRALLECVLAGPSKASLMSSMTAALQAGTSPTSPANLGLGVMTMTTALRSALQAATSMLEKKKTEKRQSYAGRRHDGSLWDRSSPRR